MEDIHERTERQVEALKEEIHKAIQAYLEKNDDMEDIGIMKALNQVSKDQLEHMLNPNY